MTSTHEQESLVEPKLLRTDSRQRVWVSRERQEAILEEFDKSGASAMRFAASVGIKYPTFANWVARRRRAKNRSNGEERTKEPRWLEAVVDEGAGTKSPAVSSMLRVQLLAGLPWMSGRSNRSS